MAPSCCDPEYIVRCIHSEYVQAKRCMQVGIAVMDMLGLRLSLVQLVETSRSYTNTLCVLACAETLCTAAAQTTFPFLLAGGRVVLRNWNHLGSCLPRPAQ